MNTFMEELQHLNIQLKDIKTSTNNFDENNNIGSGGFGKVYKGEISHYKGRSIVAFKRLDRKYGQGDPEFLKEIMLLSQYTHENLISLFGFCNEGGEKILVYEHAPLGSLDRHLRATTLTWSQRLKICLGAAKGLSYLHDPNGTQQRVLHRDIKSPNILLDGNWNAKVSDFGLSKFGPANQQHTFLISNVVGTPGYLDPFYLDMYVLTKESDVYSFGVVLFEVLCGRLCYESGNGRFRILVPIWKRSYEEKKLDEIIFQDLKQQMNSNSLKTFSDIAYQCLLHSHENRPTMAHVVKKLELALEFQNDDDLKFPNEYEEMMKTAVPPLIYSSLEEMNTLLSKGVLLNGGKTWFSVNNNGQHCEMISIAECLDTIPSEFDNYRYSSQYHSRFPVGSYTLNGKFKTHVKTQFLSPLTTYTVNLVFKIMSTDVVLGTQTYMPLKYKLEGMRKASILYLVDAREDGWLIAELFQVTSERKVIDLEILIDSQYINLVLEGIEFQPLENVGLEVDEKVDILPMSDLDTDWEHKLPNDYEEILNWSNDSMQCNTKKELYFLFCNGFSINNGEHAHLWFSLAKNGKKCYMVPARAALEKYSWGWQSLPESRFEEVAWDTGHCFSVAYEIKSQILSPQTTYASYLVYNLLENHSGYEHPIEVSNKDVDLNSWGLPDVWYIYLVSPQTPVITREGEQNTHKPLHRPKIKGLPRKRIDGWMEVQVWEFQTGITKEIIPMRMELASSNFKLLRELIVQGIEFKPV